MSSGVGYLSYVESVGKSKAQGPPARDGWAYLHCREYLDAVGLAALEPRTPVLLHGLSPHQDGNGTIVSFDSASGRYVVQTAAGAATVPDGVLFVCLNVPDGTHAFRRACCKALQSIFISATTELITICKIMNIVVALGHVLALVGSVLPTS